MEIFKCLATASSNIYAEAQAEDKTDSSGQTHETKKVVVADVRRQIYCT